MMLTVPLCTPFTQFRVSTDVGASIIDARQQRGVRAGDANRLFSVRSAAAPGVVRRNCLVYASSTDGAGRVPANRESAERRKVLLKYVRDVQPALIEQFVELGPQAVVSAMKNTITNMLGTLPPQFFTVTISTVGENMSQLMLSVMMTGYLFRNAQYRLELRNALGGAAAAARSSGTSGSSGSGSAVASTLLTASSSTTASSVVQGSSRGSGSSSSSIMQRSLSAPLQGTVLDEEMYAPGVQKSRVQGDVLLWHKENGLETLDAVQYIELLEGEVSRLRQQLQQHDPQHVQQQQQPNLPSASAPAVQADGRQLPVPVSGNQSLQQQQHNSSMLSPPPSAAAGPAGLLMLQDDSSNELLDYLRCLDAASLADLTGSADSEVAAAMENFVARLMGTYDRDSLSRAGSDCTAQEMAKVMFWLMIVGYTLRGLEVRWDMQKAALAEARFSCDNSHEAW